MGKYKAVVLFSGGIDSFACLHWAKQVYNRVGILGLYVNIGTCYALLEIGITQHFCASYGLDWKSLLFTPLADFESTLGHVPMRNVFFLELASLFGHNVVFGMLRGEYSEDKNKPFIRRMQRLLDSQTRKNLYNTGDRVLLHTPFANCTKTQVVAWLLANGVARQDIKRTTACLYGNNCGACMSCFNRWIAFENNFIDEDVSAKTALWGLQQLKTRQGVTKAAMTSVSFWTKRHWIWNVYTAYRKAKSRGLVQETPLDVLLETAL